MLGNTRLPHGPATRGFAEGIGWLAQIGLFVMLGLLASPARLPGQVLQALAIAALLTLIARRAAVLAATLPLGIPWRQQAFLSWAGLRGAMPIALTTIPMNAAVPGATEAVPTRMWCGAAAGRSGGTRGGALAGRGRPG